MSVTETSSLPAIIDRAVSTLANAKTAAEVLEARDVASLAYDVAKRTARLAKAKNAHDSLIADAYRTQAHALEIEARAKRRLADEYDAAQVRGEAAKIGDNLPSVPSGNSKPTAADLGLSRKTIHEARAIRDAEDVDPGIVKRTLDEAIAAGEEPTRARIRRAVKKAAGVQPKAKKAKKQRRASKHTPEPESRHDSDLRMLRNVWSTACESAQRAFLRELMAVQAA